MEHNITDYVGLSIPRQERPTNKDEMLTQYEIIENLYNFMWEKLYDDSLELTITFKENTLNTYSHEYIQKDLQKWVNKYSPAFRTILFKDYSKTGRLHYHGIIKPINKGLEQLDTWRRATARRYGRLELKPINSRKYYLVYILKIYINQLELTPQHIVSNDPRINNNNQMFVDNYAYNEYTWQQICDMYDEQKNKQEWKQN